MSKRKWRRGPKILSLDELVRQEVVFWSDFWSSSSSSPCPGSYSRWYSLRNSSAERRKSRRNERLRDVRCCGTSDRSFVIAPIKNSLLIATGTDNVVSLFEHHIKVLPAQLFHKTFGAKVSATIFTFPNVSPAVIVGVPFFLKAAGIAGVGVFAHAIHRLHLPSRRCPPFL